MFSPLIISLLNNQPKDTLKSMKEWLLTQFNTPFSEHSELRENYDLSSYNGWQSDPTYQKRCEIAALQIKKQKIEELKAEINELNQLKQDMNDADYKNVHLSDYRSSKNPTIEDDRNSPGEKPTSNELPAGSLENSPQQVSHVHNEAAAKTAHTIDFEKA